MDVSVISIVGFVVLGLCILLGIWKGMIRMLLNVLVIGLAIAAASLGVNPILRSPPLRSASIPSVRRSPSRITLGRSGSRQCFRAISRSSSCSLSCSFSA